MGIGNLGVSELLLVAVLILLLFGPRRLPEIGRTVGRALREFKRGMNEVRREIDEMDRATRSGPGERPDEREAPRGRLRPPGEPSDGENRDDSTPPDGEDAREGPVDG